MALSVIVVPGDGVTTQFPIPFALGYINQSDITCRVGTEVDGLGNPLYRSLTFLTADTVQVAGTPAGVGVPITFRRTVTRNQLLVDWENGAIMEESNMNVAQKQALMLVHEVLDGRFETLQSDLNMNGFKLLNVGYPTANGDAATLQYVNDVVVATSGGTVVSVAGQQGIVTSANLKTALDISAVTDATVAGKLAAAQNLNDLANKTTARTNLVVYSKSEVDTAVANALPFTPVEQGGGVGQGNAKVNIGDAAGALKATLATVDLGKIWTDSLVTSVLNAPGSVTLPNGLIVKWGKAAGASNSAITFATAFPTACYAVVATLESTDTGSLYSVHVHTVSASGFSVIKKYQNASVTNSNTAPAYWIAIGK